MSCAAEIHDSASNRLLRAYVTEEYPAAALNAPPAGNLPVAFLLGKEAEVLDFTGPLEVLGGATTKSGYPLFAPYMVAASKDPITVGDRFLAEDARAVVDPVKADRPWALF